LIRTVQRYIPCKTQNLKKKKRKRKNGDENNKGTCHEKTNEYTKNKNKNKNNLVYHRVHEYSAILTSGKCTVCTVRRGCEGARSPRMGTEGKWNV
jgi:hypothetical protein